MKKIFTLLICLSCICQAFGYDFTVDGIYYNITSTTTASVTRQTDGVASYAGSVTIPSTVTYGGTTYSVTSIGGSAFEPCSGLSSITLPGGLTSIGDLAFSDCSGLSSISIPSSVTDFGDLVFANCSNLADIYVDWAEPVAISDQLFSFFSIGSATLHVPYGTKSKYEAADEWKTFGTIVEVIPNNVIYYTSTDGKVVTPYSTSVFGANIVSNTYADGLGKIVFDGDVTQIGMDAFMNRSKLASIAIPSSVTNITIYSFKGCSGLSSITVDAGNSKYDSRNNCNAIIETSTNKLIVGCKNTTIPEGVTCIHTYAFYGCTGLTNITIPESVTRIGSSAFYECTNLTSINIPSGVTFIDDNTFYYCEKLTNITLPSGVTHINNYAFCYCKGLTNITIPNGVTKIKHCAFAGCENLTSITLPSSVTTLTYAFQNCTKLTDVYVDWAEPISIIAGVFVNSNLASATLHVPYGTKAKYEAADVWKTFGTIVEVIPNNVIYYTSTDSKVVTPYKTDVFGANIVSNTYADGQGKIVFDGDVTSIGNNAYQSRTSLTSITIPSSVTSIGDYAFNLCSKLTGITIPSSVTSIGKYAFFNCTGLTSFSLPKKVTNVGQGFLAGCYNVASITVEEGNSKYDSRNDCNAIIFTNAQTKITSLVAGCKNTVIPEGLTNISQYAFYGHSGLTSINIPSSVITIYSYAFYNCSSLTNLTISDGVKNICQYAFSGCEGLTSIAIPSSVIGIDNYAFQSCSGLTDIDVDWAEPLSITLYVFSGYDHSKVTLHVPAGTKAKYEAANVWKTFGTIVEKVLPKNIIYYTSTDGKVVDPYDSDVFGANIVSNTYADGQGKIVFDGDVTTIGEYAFFSEALSSITIPSSVTSIGEGAFSDCEDLTSITIPSSVTSIGEGAFDDCIALASITVEAGNSTYDSRNGCNAIIETENNTLIAGCKATVIPNDVTSIGEAAFSGCSGLTTINIPNSVTSIGDNAFFDCTGLTGVTIPSSVTSIGNFVLTDCTNLTSITVEAGNSTYDSRNDCNAIIETATNTLLAGCNNTTIPSSVTSIGEYAFSDCSGLTSITIPSRVTSIGVGAFSSCSGLTSINIPNSVTTIENYAFWLCTSLTSITIPSSVTSIGEGTFCNCYDLTSVTIPSSVTSIGEWAFSSCQGLTSINIPSSVTSIGKCAFNGCQGLTSITIPSSVTSIEEGAFSDCMNLSSVVFNSIPKIDSRVFSYCSNLNTYTLNLSDNSYVYTGSNDDFPTLTAEPTYSREMGTQWGTLVLPFAVAYDNSKPYDFYTLSGVSGTEISLTKVTSMLAAGTPVLVRMSGAAKNAETVKYDLSLTATSNSVSTTLKSGSSANGLTLKGTYAKKVLTTESGYIINNNSFWSLAKLHEDYPTSEISIGAFRAYLAGTLSSGAAQLRISAEEATALEVLDSLSSGEALEVYDLSGRKLNDLQQGVNIIKKGNKSVKVVIK